MRKFIKKLTTSRYYAEIFKENNQQLSELYSILQDDESRITLDGILKAYKTISRKPGYYFSEVADGECNNYHFTAADGYKVYGTDNPYFIDEIFHISKEMVYLDGGAYIGDTIQLLYKILGGSCRYVYAFEPNDENYEKLLNVAKRFGNSISCFNAGLDDHDGTVSFIKSDAGSRISENGTESIRVVDIRRFLSELKENYPSFIKLDIEGKEEDVIFAMSDYIKERKPDLAISIYHSLCDLWKIPLQIYRLNPSYKIYLRHQSNYFTETVCYATQK